MLSVFKLSVDIKLMEGGKANLKGGSVQLTSLY